MRIERDVKLDYCDVLFRPKRSTLNSRSEVDLHRDYTMRWGNCNEYFGIPIMAANMDGVGTIDMAKALMKHRMFTVLCKSYTVNDFKESHLPVDFWHYAAISTGITERDMQNTFNILSELPIQYLCIDVANGYSENFLKKVKEFRSAFENITIIAGNVVTADMTEELILNGADIAKVGIGPGSCCTTRIKTGVCYPQLSAVIECADAAHGVGGHIIADGGCACPGDVAKAFGAGADFVMLGGMLAGTDQGGGEVADGKIKFYGMSSMAAQEKHDDSLKEYRASEGRVIEVPYKGDVECIVKDILGGLRSTCTYIGARSLKEISKRTTFVQVNNGRQYNSVYESHTVGE